jgi:modulator of FtsH protease HflC
MSTLRNPVLIIAAVAAIALLSMSYFIVDEREKVLVSRFGEINQIVDKPGLYFKLPVADSVISIEDRVILWENNDRPVQDVNSQVYIVDAITLARISDPRLFRETLGADLGQAETRVGARLDSALRQTYGRRSFDAALSSDRAVMTKEIRDALRNDVKSLGIEIVDVRIRRTDQSPDVLKSTFERMQSERNALAGDIRSEGQATKTRMNAETDRTYTVKIAEAQRQSEVIKGQGDGERNKIYAEAFEKDPEFFRFYRSMQAYSKSLGKDGTTLVLNPNSEFFKYFGTQKDSSQAPAPKP